MEDQIYEIRITLTKGMSFENYPFRSENSIYGGKLYINNKEISWFTRADYKQGLKILQRSLENELEENKF